MMHPTADPKTKNYLTEGEMTSLLAAARKGKHGTRDHAMLLMAYRHGLRVSELVGLRLADVALDSGHVYVRRCKGSLSTNQPLEGDELRALRAWLRERSVSPHAGLSFLFVGERGPLTRQAVNYLIAETGKRARLPFRVNPHMLRHSCGYYLANKGYDTRLIQDYLGHKNIGHTVRYTRTAAKRFEGLFN